MQSVLSKMYAGKTVSFRNDDVDYGADLFALEISSYNKEAVIRLYFHLDTSVAEVTVTPEEIIFIPESKG